MSDFIGFLDQVSEVEISGWAMQKEDTEPVQVTLMVNGNVIESRLANEFRADLFHHNIHPDGNCGYRFDLSGSPLPDHAVVRVLARQHKQELHNSPRYYCPKGDQNKQHVLLLGLAKSGTSVIAYSLAEGLGKARLAFEPQKQQGQLDFDHHHQLVQDPAPLVTKLLLYPTLPQKLSSIGPLYGRRILLIRDPRDLLISSFFYIWYYGHKPRKEAYTKALEMVRQKEVRPDSVPFYEMAETAFDPKEWIEKTVHGFSKVTNPIKNDWLILKYEDFIDNHMEELTDYLGFPVNHKSSVDKRFERVARSKGYGSWRNWFTPEDVVYFRPKMQSFLENWGYDGEDWALNLPDALPAEEGSVYMEKLFTGVLK